LQEYSLLTKKILSIYQKAQPVQKRFSSCFSEKYDGLHSISEKNQKRQQLLDLIRSQNKLNAEGESELPEIPEEYKEER